MLVTTLPSPLIHHPPAYLPPSLSTPSLTTTLSLPPSPSPPPLLLPFPPSSSDLPGRMSASPQGLKSLYPPHSFHPLAHLLSPLTHTHTHPPHSDLLGTKSYDGITTRPQVSLPPSLIPPPCSPTIPPHSHTHTPPSL